MKTKRLKVDKINSLNYFVETCRVCMTKGESMKELFDSDSKIIGEIEYCTGITITENTTLPSSICSKCLTNLAIAHTFKATCISSDDTFRRLLEKVNMEVKSETVVEEGINFINDDENYGLCPPDEECGDDLKNDKEVMKRKGTKERARNKLKKHPPKQCRKKLYCTKCDLSFKSRIELKGHIHTLHKEDLYLICEICGKRLHSSSFIAHNRAHYPPKYNCESCDYKTVHKSDLVKHIRTHTGEKSFNCPQCESRFRFSSNLVGHIRRRHLGERRHCCPRCHMTFYSAQKLMRHLDSHDNVKRFECEVCHSSFTRTTHLRHHLLKQHSMTLPMARWPGRKRHSLTIEPSTNI